MSDEYEPHNPGFASRLGALEGTLRTFMRQWRDQDAAAALGRRVVHEKLELLTLQVSRLADDIQGVQQDVAEMRKDVDEDIMPTIHMVQADQQKQLGARGVWALIAGAVMAVVAFLAYALDKVITFFKH